MPAALLEVIWILDDFIKPPGPKMMVCVAPADGIFFRINSEDKWPVGVPVTSRANAFLHHDSFVECGGPLEFDDYVVDQSRSHQHAPMFLDRQVLPAIVAAVRRSHRISDRDRTIILAALV
ncbi:hypothetical protein [Acidisoma silvae]|uniref:Uncharacterized protein n=1 Tax=Acidisoma silvae TaxID=2802396 RepID=A0A964E125_9PROT|nr:hypothetical protein [Acidisoma silvae]MCB8877338.1 hypothetical protein [Acidisoma silvae]